MKPEQAYRIVRSAIERGDLIRPNSCERCGVLAQNTKDGRAYVQAHHRDYSKPLDVEWICAKCHRAETPLPAVVGGRAYGSKNGQAKLTEQLVVEIRVSSESGASIARRLGVSRSTVNRARSGKRWSIAAPDVLGGPNAD